MNKYSDNYKAKLDIWVKESKVGHLPHVCGMPDFGAKSSIHMKK